MADGDVVELHTSLWDVDERKIHDDLQDGLADIEPFANAIARRDW